jgi:hypothetical protein
MKQYLNGEIDSLPLGQVLAEPRGWPANNPAFEASDE